MKDVPQLLESNMEILRRIQPALARHLQERIDAVESLPEPVVRETAKGRWVSGLTEKPFFEPAPERSAKKRKGAVFFVVGVGSPPYLFQILRSLSREALAVVVVEPDLDLLLRTLSLTSVYRALPQGCRLTFIVEDDRALIDEALAHNVVPLGIFPFARAETILHPGLDEWRGDRALFEGLKREILYRLSALGNSPEDTLLGVRHGALNALSILRSPSLARLKELIGGRPLISVASGPSLEKNVHLLKGMEDRCVIVACDTVLLPLLRRGIRPHVVTTIERRLGVFETWVPPVLHEFHDACRDILLVAQSVSFPCTAGNWPGPKIVLGKLDSPADCWLVSDVLQKTTLLSGASVAHMGLTLGFALNAPAIALVGQDLAFSENDKTHIDGVASSSVADLERSRQRMRIPGSVEREVETHQIWFYFLQIFERFIDLYGKEVRVYDCTEGGARIEGTAIEPLQAFLDREASVVGTFLWDPERLAPVKWTDQEGLRFRSRLLEVLSGLASCDSDLDKMEALVDRATAPALPPARRQELAFQVAGLLDDVHRRNRVLAFIGQSYTHLAGAALAQSRFMESVDQVRSWEELHRDIIASHRANVAFLRQWLRYVEALLAPDLQEELDALDAITSPAEAEAKLSELRSGLASDSFFDALDRRALLLSELLCRFDVAEPEWSDEVRWFAARFFRFQGRPFDGSRLMAKAYESLEGQALPQQAIDAFLLDWANIEAAHDLCEEPRYQKALMLLGNVDIAGDRASEAILLRGEILRKQREFFARFRSLDGSRDPELRILSLRNRAEEALGQKRLPEALFLVQSMIDEGLETFPGTVLPHLNWLAKTTLDCRNAVDPSIAEACRIVLAHLWRDRARLAAAGFSWPSKIADYLSEEGLQVSLEVAENRKEQP
ncbi:MAG: motility associated factor glycosyltransferase family protein [Synergistaceae bacterium]|nr:motility associated factor glycosyltransferase family protein [Synergistaceae bacterium]